MQKNNLLYLIIGLLFGAIVGFVGANQLNRNYGIQSAQSLPPSKAEAHPPGAGKEQGAALPQVSEAIEKADKEPNNFEAQLKAGEMFARIQNFEKALPYFEKAQKIKPDDYQILTILGNINFDTKRWQEAEKWYARALAMKSDDIAVRTDYGITFVERENPDLERAIKEFQASLKIDPSHEPTLYNLAIAYYKKGDIPAAQETKAKLNPSSELIARLDQVFSGK